MIVTEPVPDVLDELGWTGGEAISTARRYLHYFRTTDDGRIAFGGGGRARLRRPARRPGRARLGAAVRAARGDRALLPGLRGRRIDAAWGGPVDVSPTHLPCIGSLAGTASTTSAGSPATASAPRTWAAGSSPTSPSTGATELTRLALVGAEQPPVPPEPLRYLGGSAVRAALLRQEAREDRGRPGGRARRARDRGAAPARDPPGR